MWRKDVIVVVTIFIALTYYTYELGGYMLAFATQIRMYLSIETHTKNNYHFTSTLFPSMWHTYGNHSMRNNTL